MSDGLILLGAEGQVTEFNRAAEGLLGIRRPEALGTDSRAEPLAASPLGEVLAAIAGNPAEIGGREWSLPLPDGRTAICRVSPVADDAGTHLGLALVLNDVTTLTEVSRQKSEFVSYVSHELKTPLAVIRGFADALLPPSGDTTSPAERQEFLEIIRSQTDRTIRLITNLLNVARIEAGRALDLSPAPLDLAQLAEQTIEQTQRISPRHTLRLDAPAELAPVDADPDQIGQVFLNLLSNAVKYSPDGGEVLVSVEQTEEGVHVAVRDEGMGMTTEQISRLFRRFQRVLSDPSVAAGTGLGLYLSKGIVEAHGGRIWVESALGAGSTFHFVLPR